MEAVIRTAIENVLKELRIKGVDFAVEHPSDLAYGDYSCNVAMVAMKKIAKKVVKTTDVRIGGLGENSWAAGSPSDFAKEIKKRLYGKIVDVKKITVEGPGFLNFHLTHDFFSEEIVRASKLGEDWGKNDAWKGKKVIVEYTDPNPFKEFHIGHLFTNSVGESISRLFMMSGADTKRVNYQGDVGLHVAHAIWGMQELGYAGVYDFTVKELGKAYAHGATAYEKNEKAKEEIIFINKAIYERNDEVVNALYDKGRKISLKYFETIYEIIDTKFDHMFFESEAAPIGKKLVLGHPEIFPESNGARIFKGEEYGLHTRVFLNSEGLPTYEAKDLALAKLKEEALGKYDHSIISTSNEITEYFKVLLKAMSFIFPELAEKTEHIGHGTVRLTSGKMSSRTGDVIPALDFINEIAKAVEAKMKESGVTEIDRTLTRDIAIGAIKYATLRSNILQDSVFDKEKALSFEGDSGPYLQYTHARICSVLKKAKREGIRANIKNMPKTPYEVERILYRFPEVIEEATEERASHKVVGFLTELAGEFNTFYAQEKIADKNDEFAPYKTAVTDAVRVTLKNGLWVLGIKAPERM